MYIISEPVFKKCAILKFRNVISIKFSELMYALKIPCRFLFSDHNMAAVPVRGKQRSERCATLR